MAVTKKRKRRSAPAISKSAPTRRRTYVANPARPARRRKYRGNPDDTMKIALSAVAGFIVIPKILAMLPGNALLKNVAAIGAGGAGLLLKPMKKNPYIQGLSIGLAGAGTRQIVAQYVPEVMGDALTPDEQLLLQEIVTGSQSPRNAYLTSPEMAEAVLGESIDFAGDGMEEVSVGQALDFGSFPSDFNNTLI